LGKCTYYRYDERHHLVAVTDALNQSTTLERKPGGGSGGHPSPGWQLGELHLQRLPPSAEPQRRQGPNHEPAANLPWLDMMFSHLLLVKSCLNLTK